MSPLLAHARVQMLDCDSQPAAGIGVFFAGGFIGGTTKTWYEGAAQGVVMTGPTGVAGGFNLVPGETVANGKVRALADARFGMVTLPLRAGWLSVGRVHPSQTVADFTCGGVFDTPASGPDTLSFVLRDAVTGGALPGVTVALCAAGDCATPLASAVSDSAGVGSVALPHSPGGFRGYLDVTGGGVFHQRDDLRPPFTLTMSGTEPQVLSLLTTGVAQAFGTLAGASLDAGRVHLLLFTRDCQARPASGLSVTVTGGDGSTKIVYIDGTLPDTSLAATTADGLVAVLNVPPGTVTVTGLDADGHPFGTLELPVTAGILTSGQLIPSE